MTSVSTTGGGSGTVIVCFVPLKIVDLSFVGCRNGGE